MTLFNTSLRCLYLYILQLSTQHGACQTVSVPGNHVFWVARNTGILGLPVPDPGVFTWYFSLQRHTTTAWTYRYFLFYSDYSILAVLFNWSICCSLGLFTDVSWRLFPVWQRPMRHECKVHLYKLLKYTVTTIINPMWNKNISHGLFSSMRGGGRGSLWVTQISANNHSVCWYIWGVHLQKDLDTFWKRVKVCNLHGALWCAT